MTACDDKSTTTQPQATAPAASQPAAPAVQEVKIEDVVSITTDGEIIREANAEPRIVLKSYVKNLSNKEIASIRWKNLVIANNVVLLFTDTPFKLDIKPQEAYNTTLTIVESSIIPNNRALALDPAAPRTYKVELEEVVFADGSKVTAK